MLTLQAKQKEIENLTPDKEFVRGTVGAICQVDFDEFWQDYEKWVVFKRNGYEPIKIMVNSLTNEIEIPYTILAESGEFQVGVFGVTETETLPTLYSNYIKIRYGTDTNATTPPKYTPSEIDQLRLSKQDKLTAGENITIDKNNVISATSGGTTDYELLENLPKINGVELLGDKSTSELGIDIPTKLSDLENDEGYIDSKPLENYYTKDETDNIIGGIPTGSGDNWELINKGTLAEEVAQIDITTDINGNSFSLKKMYLSVFSVKNDKVTAQISTTFTVNDHVFNDTCAHQQIPQSIINFGDGSYISVDLDWNRKILSTVAGIRGENGFARKTLNAKYNDSGFADDIYSIRLKSNTSGSNFAVGTIFKLWGVRK